MAGATIVRRGRSDDAAAIAHVHVDSWRSTYAGMLPEDMLIKLSSADREARWWRHVLGRFRRRHYVYVAEHEIYGVIGFISGGPSRDSGLEPEAEIYALYLLDEYQGEGIGRALFLRLAARLNHECGPSLVVWVLSENPSRYFYETMGGRLIARRSERMGDAEVQETAYGWADMGELVAVGRSGQTSN
ncbi:GNAT family N-acetyltransferase [Alphaproteobacteria bacterium]|nr:GNAT family N-acetyltransferase [Alphaproteobacteria bacterium]